MLGDHVLIDERAERLVLRERERAVIDDDVSAPVEQHAPRVAVVFGGAVPVAVQDRAAPDVLDDQVRRLAGSAVEAEGAAGDRDASARRRLPEDRLVADAGDSVVAEVAARPSDPEPDVHRPVEDDVGGPIEEQRGVEPALVALGGRGGRGVMRERRLGVRVVDDHEHAATATGGLGPAAERGGEGLERRRRARVALARVRLARRRVERGVSRIRPRVQRPARGAGARLERPAALALRRRIEADLATARAAGARRATVVVGAPPGRDGAAGGDPERAGERREASRHVVDTTVGRVSGESPAPPAARAGLARGRIRPGLRDLAWSYSVRFVRRQMGRGSRIARVRPSAATGSARHM